MIRIGILGYGNLGRGIESNIRNNKDMELVAIFTRRNPESLSVNSNVPVVHVDEMENWKDRIDVLILCGGSATDLPVQTPLYARDFNVIDSFDTHKNIPMHFANVNQASTEGNKIALISCGWDPGAFSFNRVMAESFLPEGNTYTFWGPGVSQGHSDAIRRIEGVKNAIQYTIPIDNALEQVRSGSNPDLTTREKHRRVCYVALEDGVDAERVTSEIVNMPNYFDEYDTEVNFVSEEELRAKQSRLPHGGFVIRSGKTGIGDNNEIIEYSLKLDSNPEFTSSVILAYARAVYRMAQKGECGAKTVFDFAPAMLSTRTNEELLNIL